MTRRLLILAAAFAALGPGAASAGAHARLVATEPARGAVLDTQPRTVVLRFDEHVEAAFGAVRVFDAGGRRVDDGRLRRPRGNTVATALRPGLADGSYTATYRLISADGHPISGGLIFSVGEPAGGPARSVDELLGATAAPPATTVVLAGARAVVYAATAVFAGTVLFTLLCWRLGGVPVAAGAAFARRRRLLLAGSAAAGIVAGAVGLVAQGATAAGTGLGDALDTGVIADVLSTRLGTVWGIRELVWAAAGGAALAGAPVALQLVPSAFLVVAPALGGHAGQTSPRGALVAADTVHVAAMSLWLGGLVALLVAVPAATRLLPAEQRSALLARVLARFSALALIAVVLLVATGTLQSVVHLTAFADLLDSAFGRAVAIKVVLLLALIGLGALQRRRLLPALRRVAAGGAAPGRAGIAIRRALRGEVALVAVVLGATGALAGYAPPASLAGGPFATSERVGPLTLEVTLDPARSGPNELHLYLFRASDGAPFNGTKELTVTLQEPERGIGPLETTMRRAGPGHYVADSLQISPAGDWELEIAVRVSEFDEYRKRLRAEVRT